MEICGLELETSGFLLLKIRDGGCHALRTVFQFSKASSKWAIFRKISLQMLILFDLDPISAADERSNRPMKKGSCGMAVGEIWYGTLPAFKAFRIKQGSHVPFFAER